MALSVQLAALQDMLRTGTCRTVFIGRPDKDVQGLYLWPWKLDVQANLSKMPPVRQRDFLRTKKPERLLQIRFLVIPVAGSEIESCDALAAALKIITDHPILVADKIRGQLRNEAMSCDELTAVFAAAGLPLKLCLTCTLEIPG